jgi:diguanylate cyclase (GGDEF)-like protein
LATTTVTQDVDFDDTGRALRHARRLRVSSVATAMLVVAVFSVGFDHLATRYIGGITAKIVEVLVVGVALVIVSSPLSRMLRTSIIELHEVREKWRQDASRDVLTGLFNRRYFDARLAEETARSRRHGNPLSLLMIDIDRFKTINDRYGHAVGDAALRDVATRVRSMFRREDVVTRIGGDELAVILPDTETDHAFEKAELLRAALSREAFVHHESGASIRITVSCGVCGFAGSMHIEELLKCADESLYEAKTRRNSVAAVQLASS